MTTTVLAYFPSPGQGVWHLGPIPIRAYALCIIAGIIAALMIGDRRWVARGGERGVVYDVALWAVPFGLVGGRLYHVLTDWKTYFGPGGAGLGAALRIWEGGLGIWGAVFLGGVGAWIACRIKGIPLPAFGDAVAPGIVLAQAIGRLGNYFNQELYGRETTVPWGMQVFYRRDASGAVDVHSLDGVSTGDVAAVVHPTFLYEMLWNLLVFFFLLWADRKFRLGHGRLFALYVASYCVGRFWVELMRDDTATHIAGIRINVFTATFVFIGAVVYMLLAPKGRENPASLRGRQPVEARQESRVEEWAEDLVSVATGGGIVAAATVAGDHDVEDAEAVGDTDDEVEADEIDEVEVDEVEVDETEADEIKVDDVEVGETDEADVTGEKLDDEIDAELAADWEAEADAADQADDDGEPEAAKFETEDETDETEDAVVDDDVKVVEESEVAIAAEAENVETDEATVVVYEDGAAETDTVIVYESGIDEPVADDVVAEAEDEPEAEVEPEPEDEPEAKVEPEPEKATAPEPEPEPKEEPEAEPEADVVAEAESVVPAPANGTADTKSEAENEVEGDQPKLGSTFKRLLWGAGNRGRD